MGRRLLTALLLAVVVGTLTPTALAGAQDDPTYQLSLAVTPSPVTTGGKVTATATLTATGASASGRTIDFSSYDWGTRTSSTQSVVTGADGTATATVTVVGTLGLDAYLDGDTSGSASASTTVPVRPRIGLRAADTVAGPLRLVPTRYSALPADEAEPVLQVWTGGRWSAAPDARGVWAGRAGTIRVRVYLPAGSAHLAGASPVKTIKVGRAAPPAWLLRLNRYRALNNAAAVAVDPVLSHGDALHVRYMVRTGDFNHTEKRSSRWYTRAGAQAGASSDISLGDAEPIRSWIQAPFHAVSELDRRATLAGFATSHGYSALWLDPSTSRRAVTGPSYQFPADGRTTNLYVNNAATETPSPLADCTRTQRAVGVYGLGLLFANDHTPRKVTASLYSGRTRLRVCISSWYGTVIVLPLKELEPRHSYTARIAYDGRVQSRWTFHVR